MKSLKLFILKLICCIDDVMYPVLNSFLLLKPNMDVHNIPEFYKLFNSSAQEVRQM